MKRTWVVQEGPRPTEPSWGGREQKHIICIVSTHTHATSRPRGTRASVGAGRKYDVCLSPHACAPYLQNLLSRRESRHDRSIRLRCPTGRRSLLSSLASLPPPWYFDFPFFSWAIARFRRLNKGFLHSPRPPPPRQSTLGGGGSPPAPFSPEKLHREIFWKCRASKMKSTLDRRVMGTQKKR